MHRREAANTNMITTVWNLLVRQNFVFLS